MTLQDYRTLIGYRVQNRLPVRSQSDEICRWLSDNDVQFQYMCSIRYPYKTTSLHHKQVTSDLLNALDAYRSQEYSYFICYENFPVPNCHLYLNSNRLLSKRFISEYFERRGIDVKVSKYRDIGAISYGLKSMGWDRNFEYDLSPNIFTVKLGGQ